MGCDNKTPHYDINDILPIVDENGRFIDFVLKSGHPIITDYNLIDREIIVRDNVITLGNRKEKHVIETVAELEKKLHTLFLIVHKSSLINIARWTAKPDFIDEMLHELYDTKFVEIVFQVIHQVIFDILYDKYQEESPLLTLNQYCEEHICYDWDKSIINNEKKLNKKAATKRWMKAEIEREIKIKNNPALREDSIKLGRNPDTYIEFISKLNEPFKTEAKKTKTVWDHLYYNGHPDLIMSKQFRRSFVKERLKNNNYSADVLEDYFKTYDTFVQMTFTPEQGNARDYFEKSMGFYHLEIYKRIDFIYKLAVSMEAIGMTTIDRNSLLVKRFDPVVFWPCIDGDNNCLRYSEKSKYYRPLLLAEELWRKPSEENPTQLDSEITFDIWQYWYLFRAKIYELFKYHYKFISDDFNDISSFISEHYNVLSYQTPDKVWIQDNKEKKRDREIRIKNALVINESLFWDSDKRKPY